MQEKGAPSVYLYRKTDKGHELYLGEFTTLEGLALLDGKSKVKISDFGAQNYKGLSWASEVDLPEFSDVASIIRFLDAEGDIDMVDFSADIEGVGSLSTHDDGECHFIFTSALRWMDLVGAIALESNARVLIDGLLSNQDSYLTISEEGLITKHGSFDDYLSHKEA